MDKPADVRQMCLFIAILFATFISAPGQVTYRYTGQSYNPNTHVCDGTYLPCTHLRILGALTLPHAIAANFSGSIVPSSFSFSDGAITLSSSMALGLATFQVSTDSGGNILSWNIMLETIATADACASVNTELIGTSGNVSSGQGGDYSCYSSNLNTPQQAFGAGGNNVIGAWMGGFMCPVGTTIPVTLQEVSVTPTISVKPWQISYAPLSLNFSVSGSSSVCTAVSNQGSLEVDFNTSLGSFHIANSVAVAQVSAYQPSGVSAMPSCSFAWLSTTTNNCLLNGAFDPNASYASWSTTGFTTNPLPTVQSLIPGPGTGPLSFWVNLDALGVSTSSSSMDAILTTVEPYVHETLIANLPYFAWYTVVQDPGNVGILVVNSSGLTAGSLPNGRGTTFDIPQSLNYPSTSNPAVVLQNPPDGNYEIILSGLSTGSYELAVSGTSVNHQSSQQVMNGSIVQNQTIAYPITLNTSAVGQTQTMSLGSVIAGDLNGDQVVDCKDLAVVKASFGKRKGQQGYNAWADINGDGVVNILDLMYVAQRIPAGTSCSN